jgi:hypothetical protein
MNIHHYPQSKTLIANVELFALLLRVWQVLCLTGGVEELVIQC